MLAVSRGLTWIDGGVCGKKGIVDRLMMGKLNGGVRERKNIGGRGGENRKGGIKEKKLG